MNSRDQSRGLGYTQARKADEALEQIDDALKVLEEMAELIQQLNVSAMTQEGRQGRARALDKRRLKAENALLRAIREIQSMKRG